MLYLTMGLVLAAFWLLLSGHYTFITLSAGLLSVIGTIALGERMKLVDREGHPIHLLPAFLTYFPWLVWEIMKAAWDVTKVILHPALPISPTIISVKASQKTAAGLATYANSITLTPGTITARVNGHDFLIHALTQAGARDLAGGAMNRRVTRFEGGK
ncbi:MAG: Na+/H+ antiporter subunit E [Pseudomonadota bacterium]|nr:Na+/H+ antiporter subunit E [Pseudomonadota bacterium]